MALKNLLEGAGSWLKNHRLVRSSDCRPELDGEGLINGNSQGSQSLSGKSEGAQGSENRVIVKSSQASEKAQSLEKVQEGFDKLISQLEGIREHLSSQIDQHSELMGRIDKLPKLLESFPSIVENQKQLTEQLIDGLKAAGTKDQQFIDVIEKIPTETARQTDALTDVNHQLAAAADVDVQMAESFNKFNETLVNLNQSTLGQTDSIMQMSKTFATSDRYLKYLLTKQNRRFMWIFFTAMGVCVGAILILTGIVIFLRS